MKIVIYHSKENSLRKRLKQNSRCYLLLFFFMNIYVDITCCFFVLFSPYNTIIIIPKPVGFRF